MITSNLQLAHNATEFLTRVSRSGRPALLLDYDGTLAPFTKARSEASIYPEIAWLLQRIQDETNTRMVMISGRAARELRSMLLLNPAPEIWGTHGLERLWPDGSYQLAPLDADQLRALITAQRAVAGGIYGSSLEHKPGALALHWRGLEPSSISALREFGTCVWGPIARESGLMLTEFDGGLELRLQSHNKGDAVRGVLAELRESDVAAYLGDDRTDEDAFLAMRHQDLPILVRREYRTTTARLWIQPPDGLFEFLTRWLKASGGAL